MTQQPPAATLTPEQEDLRELTRRLARVQSTIADPVKATEGDATFSKRQKDGQFKQYKFADLVTVLQLVRPALSAEGLAFTQELEGTDTQVRVCTVLMYGLASRVSTWAQPMPPMPLSKSGEPLAMGQAQKIGACITYARRKSLLALLGIQDEEQDDPDLGEREERAAEKAGAERRDAIREKAQGSAAARSLAVTLADDELRAAAKALQVWAQDRGVTIPAKGVLSRLFELKGWDVTSREHHALWTAALADSRAEAKILDTLRQIAPAPAAAPAQPPAPQMQREATALDAEKAMSAFAKSQNWPSDHHHVVSALALLAADLGQNAEYPSPRDRGVQVAKLTDPKQVEVLRVVLADAFPPF